MMSVERRPTIRTYPSGSMVATSPVTNQPSRKAASVASGRLR